MGNRLQWLDVYRGLASLGVVYFHLNEVLPDKDSTYLQIVKYGWLGVPVFFFISGFCMKMILDNHASPTKFFIQRVFRIYPAYFFSLGVVLLAVFIRLLQIGVNDIIVLPKDLKSLFATFTILTDPAFDVPTINWVYWSLTYEIVFYFVISLGLVFSKWWKELFLLGFVILSCVVNPTDFHPIFFLHHFGSFMLGYHTFGLLYKTNRNEVLFSIFGIGLSISSILINAGSLEVKAGIEYSISLLFILLSAIIFRFIPMKFPSILQNIGLFSYSLYLIHVPLGVYLLARFRNESILASQPLHFFSDTLIAIALILISSQIFKFIEDPSHKLGKRITTGTPIKDLAWKFYRR